MSGFESQLQRKLFKLARVILTYKFQFCVQEFQNDDEIPLFLLTSQVGGLGLTLTGADRVVIVDPAWNPRYIYI